MSTKTLLSSPFQVAISRNIETPTAGWQVWLENNSATNVTLIYLPWERMQACPNCKISWDATVDANVAYWQARGYRVVLGVKTVPTWARRWPAYKNSKIWKAYWINYATFVYAALVRYGVNDVVYWNEPDVYPPDAPNLQNHLGGWGDPGMAYYGGRHYGNFVNYVTNWLKGKMPGLKVHLSGVLNSRDPRQGEGHPGDMFFAGMVSRLDVPFKIDYVHVHAYAYWQGGALADPDVNQNTAAGWYGLGTVRGKLRYYRDLLEGRCSSCAQPQLWVTEYALMRGTNTDCNAITYQQQKAQYVWRGAMRALYETRAQEEHTSWWFSVKEDGWQCVGMYGYPAQDAYEFLNQFQDWEFFSYEDYGGTTFEDYVLRKWMGDHYSYVGIYWSNTSATRCHGSYGAAFYNYLGIPKPTNGCGGDPTAHVIGPEVTIAILP